MKGIVLAGGSGTRLYPVTQVISKQLLPVYDKPMVYYSLATLMQGGIREILLISSPQHISLYQQLLGNGEQWGIEIQYAVQEKPEGLPQAFIIGERFIGNDGVCLILGDNIFYGADLDFILREAAEQKMGATVFGYQVKDPQRYGVIEYDGTGRVISMEEKPDFPKSNIAITGIYFCDNRAPSIAKELEPSRRNETEIVDLLNYYRDEDCLWAQVLKRGIAWLDTGTHESLDLASKYISAIETRQGIKVACLEEIALENKWINLDSILKQRDTLLKSSYGEYVLSLTSALCR